MSLERRSFTGTPAVAAFPSFVVGSAGLRRTRRGPVSTGADDLLALIDYLKIGKFHLVATAGGGFVAADFAPKTTRFIATPVQSHCAYVHRQALKIDHGSSSPLFPPPPTTYTAPSKRRHSLGDILSPMPPRPLRFPTLGSFRRISEKMRTRAQKYPRCADNFRISSFQPCPTAS